MRIYIISAICLLAVLRVFAPFFYGTRPFCRVTADPYS